MNAPSPLPSLFGRFTAIFQDHDHLGDTLRRLRDMCSALENGESPLPGQLAPDVLLAALRDDLTAHFGAEESAEYFGVVVEEEPSLTYQITGLKNEHVSMLRAIESLSQLSKDHARWAHLPTPTRALVADLERHERAESSLLRSLFRSKP